MKKLKKILRAAITGLLTIALLTIVFYGEYQKHEVNRLVERNQILQDENIHLKQYIEGNDLN